MVLLRLDSLALARSRFALSPLAETVGAAIVLGRPCADPWLAAWHARHHRDFRARLDADPFARGLVTLIGATKYLPDHVSLPPGGGTGTALESELAAMTRVPDTAVRASLTLSVAHSWERHGLDWLTGHGWAARTAELFRDIWREHLAADWPARRALLERDITHRAGLIAAHGWPRALHRMSRRSAWVGTDAIRFSDRPGPDRVIGEHGMLFVPVCAPRGTWLCEAPGQPYALVYPARGTGAAGQDHAADPSGRALARLIGPGRAAVLRELARPATTTELATALSRSPGTISAHLTVLREAGLVTPERSGRRVVYRRTPLATRLTTGAAREAE